MLVKEKSTYKDYLNLVNETKLLYQKENDNFSFREHGNENFSSCTIVGNLDMKSTLISFNGVIGELYKSEVYKSDCLEVVSIINEMNEDKDRK